MLVSASLLFLPFSLKEGVSISIEDAIFTASSALCVTGLVVHNTFDTFNFFGQLVIAITIQIGGLGYMSLIIMLTLLFKKKVSLRNRIAVQESFVLEKPGGMIALIIKILKTTLLLELTGSFLLFFYFIYNNFHISKALWFSIFHAISAFCNAGFDLFENSFLHINSTYFLSVISLLVIIGGLGFLVIDELKEKRFKLKKLSLHSKVVLLTTVILLFLGFVFFKLKGASFIDAFFMSVTARTAGFSVIDVGLLSNILIFILMFLMFIGASPASTGGGIKTSSFFLLTLPLKALITKKNDFEVFNRKINPYLITKALSIVMIYLTLSMTVALIINSTDKFPLYHCIFESISAIGTVGLSTGITSSLSASSKFLLIILMFIGRIGPITIAMSLLQANNRSSMIQYPCEKVFL